MNGEALRDVMRAFPQGVVVVTAEGRDGPRGITVSSFISISLTPPLVLVCIMNGAQAHDAIGQGRFVVNLLSQDQGALSDHFARPNLTSEEQFAAVELRTGVFEDSPPVIDGCLGYLDCRVVDRASQADHTLFVGRVESSKIGEPKGPLVFYAREYRGIGESVYDRD